jgi:hypothetical protein
MNEDKPMVFTAEQFPSFLREMAKHYGGISRMARQFGLDVGNLGNAIRGKRRPSPKFLRWRSAGLSCRLAALETFPRHAKGAPFPSGRAQTKVPRPTWL